MATLGPCPICGAEVDLDRPLCSSCRRNLRRRRPEAPTPKNPEFEQSTSSTPPEGHSSSSDRASDRTCHECAAPLFANDSACVYCGAEGGAADQPRSEERVSVTLRGVEVALPSGGALRIGRSAPPFAGALQDLDQLSRDHADVIRSDDGVYITDLGSLNGTYVDDRRLEARVPERVEPSASVRLASDVSLKILWSVPTAPDHQGGPLR